MSNSLQTTGPLSLSDQLTEALGLLVAALDERDRQKARADQLEAERLRLAGVAAALDSESLPGFVEQLLPGDTGLPIVRRLLAALGRPIRTRSVKPRQLLNPTTQGQRIKARRLDKHMTLKVLAGRAHLPVSTLSHYEHDRFKLPADVLACLALALGCEVADLAAPPAEVQP